MMCGGGGITDWMIGEVVTEDEDEEGLDSTEGVIFFLSNCSGLSVTIGFWVWMRSSINFLGSQISF
jgi:hypothetical protein